MVLGVILLICATMLYEGSSSATQLNNSSLSLILADQCVTREEVQQEIRVSKEELLTEIRTIKEELLSEIRVIKEELQANTKQVVKNDSMIEDSISLPLGTSSQNPAQSCSSIQGQPSGYYWIHNAITGTPTRQYCDMTRRCCGSTGGWMQVANLDMTDSSQQCPSGFNQITSPRRMCTRYNSGCVSASFPVHGVEYSRVCGRVIGYQFGSPNAFNPYYQDQLLSINNTYVDGVSVTHGHSPRKHIWTFAAAIHESITSRVSAINHKCPCTRTDRTFTGAIPPFVGNDYFCETGSRSDWTTRYYTEDPLWDGRGCGSISSCCSFNNPPWFCKRLPQPTGDDIEVRICSDQAVSNEDIGVDIIELYVQ